MFPCTQESLFLRYSKSPHMLQSLSVQLPPMRTASCLSASLRQLASCWTICKSVSLLTSAHHPATLPVQAVVPETRTYNTIINACNRSGQPDEGYKVYERMLREGAVPSATTYTALISAYGKIGKVGKRA